MLRQTEIAPAPAELLGDVQPLIEQLGSFEGLAALAGAADPLAARPIATISELRAFLRGYHTRILQPLELPAIQRAFNHASRGELRELVAFDHELSAEPSLKNFAVASRLVGQQQLQRLRPLRDQRVVQRYLSAVELGQAHGWHTLTYGLTLAVYFVPLRQGMIAYAWQTTRSFIQSAARAFPLAQSDELLAELSADVPAAVEALLAQNLTV
jgi:urease accessory protein UreF